jgi:small subunit ribosomal protein S1
MTDDTEDFASMFAAQEGVKAKKLHAGDKVTAKVIHLGKEDVFFAISAAQEGSMPRLELTDKEGKLTVKVGSTVDAYVVRADDVIVLTKKLGKDNLDVDMLEEARAQGIPIEGTVTGVNKGGLEVQLGAGGRGFCPIGQADLGFVEDAQALIGKTLQFLVREVSGRNVVLSRRALLEREREASAKEIMRGLQVGQRLQGKVTRIAGFGAFVDLGGVDGMIPVSELSHVRVKNVEDVLKVGDAVTVDVLRIEDDPKRPGKPRIALSLKATQADPLTQHLAELKGGQLFRGTVEKIEAYGAFVTLFPGVTGLVHVSELSHKRVRHPSDVVAVGQEVEVRVLSVSPETRKVALSMKDETARSAGPSPAQSESAREQAEERAIVAQYSQSSSKSGLGTLGDLMKKKR